MNEYLSIKMDCLAYYHKIDYKPEPDKFSKHCHNMYEVIYIKEGSGFFHVEGMRYKINNNTLLIFKPLEFHYVEIIASTSYERYVINFEESAIFENHDELLEIFKKRNLGSNNIMWDEDKSLEALFMRFDHNLSLNDLEKNTMTKLLLNELLILLRNKYSLKLYNLSGEKLIVRIINYINDNLTSQIKLEQLSERFFISKYHLQHMFKKHTGIPIMEYIIRKRILKAQQLIEEGLKTSKAASICGFNDYSSFYRAYVKHTGTKPSDKINK